MLTIGVNGGKAYLIRTGPVVYLSLDSITFDGSNPSYGEILRLPSGFRPAVLIRENYDSPTSDAQIAIFSSSGGVNTNRPLGDILRRSFTYVTADIWPSQLPGTDA